MSDPTCPNTKTQIFSNLGSGTTYQDRNDPDPPPDYASNTKYFRGDIVKVQAVDKVYYLDTTSQNSGTDVAPSHTSGNTNNWRYINSLTNYQAGAVENHTVVCLVNRIWTITMLLKQ